MTHQMPSVSIDAATATTASSSSPPQNKHMRNLNQQQYTMTQSPITAITDTLTSPSITPMTPGVMMPSSGGAANSSNNNTTPLLHHHHHPMNRNINSNPPSLNYLKHITQFLLQHSLILTSLEFYTEVKERFGLENHVLRRYFVMLEGMDVTSGPYLEQQQQQQQQGNDAATLSATPMSQSHDNNNEDEDDDDTATNDTATTSLLNTSGHQFLTSELSQKDDTISQLQYQIRLLKSEMKRMREMGLGLDASVEQKEDANGRSGIKDPLKEPLTSSTNQKANSNHHGATASQPPPSTKSSASTTYSHTTIQSKLMQNQRADVALTESDYLLLNQLVMDYFKERDYTMSMVSFSDEGDFASTKDPFRDNAAGTSSGSGGAHPSQPSLSQQFSLSDILLNWKLEKSSTQQQETIKKWEEKLSEKQQEVDTLRQQLLESENKHIQLEQKHSKAEEKIRSMYEKIQKLENQVIEAAKLEPITSPTSPLEAAIPSLDQDDETTGEESSSTTKNLAQQYTKAVTVMNSLSDNLPQLMSGTKKSSKPLLVPFIVSVFENSQDEDVKRSMVETVLDMNKKPSNKEQRKSVVDSVLLLVENLSQDDMSKQLLGVMRERMDKGLSEAQSLLYCDLIVALSEHLYQSAASSDNTTAVDQYLLPLLLHLRQKVMEEVSANSDSNNKSVLLAVRKHFCSALAAILPLGIPSSRYNKVEQIVVESLEDDLVSASALDHLVSPFVHWCAENNILFSQFLPSFLRLLKKYLLDYKTRVLSMILRTYKTSLNLVGDYLHKEIPQEEVRLILKEMNLLEGESASSEATDEESTEEAAQSASTSEPAESSFQEQHKENVHFILNQMLPQMISILCELDSTVDGLVRDIYAFWGELSESSGPLMKQAIRKRFLQVIHREYTLPPLGDSSSSNVEKTARQNALICYLCGPLSFESEQKQLFSDFITDSLMDIVHQKNGWKRKDMSLLIFVLKAASKLHKLQKRILSVLGALIVHEDKAVKVAVCELFVGIIPVLDTENVLNRVLPCFITLGHDQNAEVRLYALEGLSAIVRQIGAIEDVEKISMAFDPYFESSDTSKRALQVLTNIIPESDKNFRETYILKKLLQIANSNHENQDEMEREHLVNLLLEAYKALNGVTLSKTGLREYIIPGLELIEKDAAQMPDKVTHQEITRMLKDLRGLLPKSEIKSPLVKGKLWKRSSNKKK